MCRELLRQKVRVFKCGVCGKCYSYHSTMVLHEARHEDEQAQADTDKEEIPAGK